MILFSNETNKERRKLSFKVKKKVVSPIRSDEKEKPNAIVSPTAVSNEQSAKSKSMQSNNPRKKSS